MIKFRGYPAPLAQPYALGASGGHDAETGNPRKQGVICNNQSDNVDYSDNIHGNANKVVQYDLGFGV